MPTKVSSGELTLGNITSVTWMDNYRYFATASGSLEGNHDNSINVYRVYLAINDLLLKKLHSLTHCHGKYFDSSNFLE